MLACMHLSGFEYGYARRARKRCRSALWVLLVAFSVHNSPASAANEAGQSHPGAHVYLRFCAGCHGFDGFSRYALAPSFALGERLYKSDDELLRSVLAGRHAMPYWENKLSIDHYRRAIAYLRLMDQRHRSGQPPRSEPLPEMHYRFNPVGEDEKFWMYWDY